MANRTLHDWASVPNGIAIYAKIASILRSQISSGSLAAGAQLPSIARLSGMYKVAPVTIRLAVRLLAEEGLLSSHRGRGTFVTALTKAKGKTHVADGHDPVASESNVAVRLIHRARLGSVPDDLRFGNHSEGDYEWIRRLYERDGKTVFLMDAFVADELFAKLPPDLDHRLMIPDLLRKEFTKRKVDVLTTVTVSSADFEAAGHLRCDLSFPIAQIARTFLDSSERILVATKATYRADHFQMQTRQPIMQFLSSRSASSVKAGK